MSPLQLPFRWPEETSYAADDFFICEANEEAARFLDGWPAEAPGAVLLSGPAACGKTHLAQRWAGAHNAIILEPQQLGTASSEELWHTYRAGLLEDIHNIRNEAALFHLLRHAENQRLNLLLTSRQPAQQLPFTLPDLRSRLTAMQDLRIETPDEALLRTFLVKSFSDRQWRVSPDVTEYLLKRMERSFAGAAELIDLLERHMLQSNREMNIPFVRACLERKQGL